MRKEVSEPKHANDWSNDEQKAFLKAGKDHAQANNLGREDTHQVTRRLFVDFLHDYDGTYNPNN